MDGGTILAFFLVGLIFVSIFKAVNKVNQGLNIQSSVLVGIQEH